MNAVFLDRYDAGQKLAQQLSDYTNKPDTIVLGLPRGGVPVAYEIAKSLNIPWDVCLIRKIGLPEYPETAMGAVADDVLLHNCSDSITVVDPDMAKTSGLNPEQIQAIAAREKAELRWRESCYRHSRPIRTFSTSTRSLYSRHAVGFLGLLPASYFLLFTYMRSGIRDRRTINQTHPNQLMSYDIQPSITQKSDRP